MSEYRFPKPFVYDTSSNSGHKPNQNSNPLVEDEVIENVPRYDDVVKEYAPTIIPPSQPKEYIPRISPIEHYNNLKKLRNNPDPQPIEDKYEEDKAESYAMPAKFLIKDETSDQDAAVKVQILVDKLQEYKDKIMALRDSNLESAKSNVEKSREIELLKLQKETLEKQLSEVSFISTHRGKGGIIRLKEKSNAEELLRRRQEMQQELLMGINLVGGEVADLVGRAVAKKNFFQKLADCLGSILNKFIILKGDIKTIDSRYDKSISAYFSFHKFVTNLSLVILAVYLYLLITHIFQFDDSLSSTCSGTLCLTLYYGFGTNEALTYVSTFVGMILITIIAGISKWIRADKMKVRTEVYGGSEAKLKKFSAIAFNSWPWSINTEPDSADQSVNISNVIQTALKDFVRQKEAANRTAAQKTTLLIRRAIGSIIFLLILGTGWVAIVLLAISDKTIRDYFEDSNEALSITMNFLPKFGISIVNALFPALTTKITALENWDSPSFIIRVQIIRLYLAKVLNIILYAGLNLELATGNSWFGDPEGRIPFLPTDYNCREDQAGLNLMILVISETLTSKIIPLLMNLVYWGLAKKNTPWKKEIKVSQQVISLIYFQGLVWITLPFFPYVAFLAPLLLFADFKFNSWKLRRLQAKPLEQTQSYQILIVIMNMFNLTLIIIIVYFGYFLTVGITHSIYGGSGKLCGPYESLTPANDILIAKIKDTMVLSQIWTYVLNYSPVFWVVLLLCITQIIFSRNKLNILEAFLKEREYETDHQLEELQKKNAKLLKKEQYKEIVK